jgi:DNA polymerase-3 subunit epsilon|tara:strand:- start:3998 stop:4675 length:678 start_codon:yes stop_codon:yes gene_type:complete
MIEVILDTETTGLSVREGHRIVEIGCLELENRIPTKNIFHYYLNPERKVSPEAFKVHGYTDEFLSNQKKFEDIANEFLEFIEGKNLIIHNAGFDMSHLNNELKLIGKKTLSTTKVVDTLEIAREKFPGSQISLDALCKKFRIDNSKREKHSAIIDCELLAKVYINLIDEKEPLLDFSTEKNYENLKDKNDVSKIKFSKIKIVPTEEEVSLHKAFLKREIKKNFYS